MCNTERERIMEMNANIILGVMSIMDDWRSQTIIAKSPIGERKKSSQQIDIYFNFVGRALGREMP